MSKAQQQEYDLHLAMELDKEMQIKQLQQTVRHMTKTLTEYHDSLASLRTDMDNALFDLDKIDASVLDMYKRMSALIKDVDV